MSKQQVGPHYKKSGTEKVRSQPKPLVNENMGNVGPQGAQQVSNVQLIGFQNGQPTAIDLILVFFPGEQIGSKGNEQEDPRQEECNTCYLMRAFILHQFLHGYFYFLFVQQLFGFPFLFR